MYTHYYFGYYGTSLLGPPKSPFLLHNIYKGALHYVNVSTRVNKKLFDSMDNISAEHFTYMTKLKTMLLNRNFVASFIHFYCTGPDQYYAYAVDYRRQGYGPHSKNWMLLAHTTHSGFVEL